MTLEISLRAIAQGFESLPLRQTKQTPTGRLFRFSYGGIRTGRQARANPFLSAKARLSRSKSRKDFLAAFVF